MGISGIRAGERPWFAGKHRGARLVWRAPALPGVLAPISTSAPASPATPGRSFPPKAVDR
jgi:hypothetical protein